MTDHHCPMCGQLTNVTHIESRGFWECIDFECFSCGEKGVDFENAIAPNAAISPTVTVPVLVDMAAPSPLSVKKPTRKPKPRKRTRKLPQTAYEIACAAYEAACVAYGQAVKLQRAEGGGKAARRLAAVKMAAAWAKREAMKITEKSA